MNFSDFLNFLHTYGYIVVFISAFLESLILVGMILPGALVVLFGGYVAGQGNIQFIPVLVLAFLGMFLGDIANYMLGTCRWQTLIPSKKILAYIKKKEGVAYTYLRQFGMPLIVYAHMIGYFRSFICFAAGSANMPFKKYLIAVALASFLWSCIFVTVGYVLGQTNAAITNINQQIQYFFLGMLVLLGVFKFLESKMQAYMKDRLQKRNSKDSDLST